MPAANTVDNRWGSARREDVAALPVEAVTPRRATVTIEFHR